MMFMSIGYKLMKLAFFHVSLDNLVNIRELSGASPGLAGIFYL